MGCGYDAEYKSALYRDHPSSQKNKIQMILYKNANYILSPSRYLIFMAAQCSMIQKIVYFLPRSRSVHVSSCFVPGGSQRSKPMESRAFPGGVCLSSPMG